MICLVFEVPRKIYNIFHFLRNCVSIILYSNVYDGYVKVIWHGFICQK